MVLGIIFLTVYLAGVYMAWYILKGEEAYIENEHVLSEKSAKRLKRTIKIMFLLLSWFTYFVILQRNCKN